MAEIQSPTGHQNCPACDTLIDATEQLYEELDHYRTLYSGRRGNNAQRTWEKATFWRKLVHTIRLVSGRQKPHETTRQELLELCNPDFIRDRFEPTMDADDRRWLEAGV